MMKFVFLASILCLTAACTRRQPVAAAEPTIKEQKRTVDRRVKALDRVLAKGETPDSPELIGSLLTPQAMRELSLRVPNAANVDSSVRFTSPGVAVVTLNYTVPESPTPRTQLVEFVFANEQWSMSWKPGPADEEKPAKPSVPLP